MIREELENAVNNIGDDLIEDAGKLREKKPKIAMWTKAAAACAALVIVGAGVFAVMKYGAAQKSDKAFDEYGSGYENEGVADIDSQVKDEELFVKEQSNAGTTAENGIDGQYIIGKLIYDDAVFNYVENENSGIIYKIENGKFYRNTLPDGTYTDKLYYLGATENTELPEDFKELFKNQVWYEYGSVEELLKNTDSAQAVVPESGDVFFYLLTMKNSDLLLCRGFNKDTDEEFIRWIQKLELHNEQLSYPTYEDSFVCVSEKEEVEISVSNYKEYAVRDAFPEIDVLWKYSGEGEFELCTYCSLEKKVGDKWEDCPLDSVFDDVLYVLKKGGEAMMHYDLNGVKFEDGANYRLCLGGFGETGYYVEFTYPAEEIPQIMNDVYIMEKEDGEVLAKSISVNTETQRFVMNLDPLSSYMPAGYYLNDGGGVTFYTEDGQYALQFRRDGEKLIYEGDAFQNIKNGDVFEMGKAAN